MTKLQVQEINLSAKSDTVFFLIHGYTGSPTDFNELPQYLHDTYGVGVKVMLLPGHGTRIEDLDTVQYHDFLHRVETALQAELAAGRKVILGGVSFGGLLGLILAGKYPVEGLVTLSVPYRLKFPFNLPGVRLLKHYKKYWRKKNVPGESKLREKAFRYEAMHVNALKLVRQARREVQACIPRITCPVLLVHSMYDPIGAMQGVHELRTSLRAPTDLVLLKNPNHNIFFSPQRFDVYRKIEEFFALAEPNSQPIKIAEPRPRLGLQEA